MDEPEQAAGNKAPFSVADKIAKAILYEGYLLYPYHRNSTKNVQRWTLGGLYPDQYVKKMGAGSDASLMQVEFLILGTLESHLTSEFRFLQLSGEVAEERTVPAFQTRLSELLNPKSRSRLFSFQAGEKQIQGSICAWARQVAHGGFRITLQVQNESPLARREELLQTTLVSPHFLLGVEGGEFVSLLEPQSDFERLAEECKNIGMWPVLAGSREQRNILLCSPIILYDYPEIAPESPGDLFDGTEIDEILSLRILTLTDEEKREARASDPKVAELLDRVETLGPEALGKLHGRLRRLNSGLRSGDRVRLKPKRRADIFDIALKDKMATILGVEEDFEGRIYYTVTIDDDPGKDLGIEGKPGHRFFFMSDEVEAV